MNVRTFALIMGIVYTIVGLMGLLGIGVTHGAHLAPAGAELTVEAQYGLLLGLFPVNILHNLFHLAIGIWGIVAYNSFGGARGFSKSLAVIYAVLGVMGLFPILNTFFGLIPLFAHDVWLHLGTAAVAAYFGFVHHGARRDVRDSRDTTVRA